MFSDDRAHARAELLVRVDQVANGPASLEALYELDTAFVYTDFGYLAGERLSEVLTAQGPSSPWAAQLRRPPPDLKLWVPFFDRKKVTDESIRQATERWAAKGSERIFGPRHYVARMSDGVAAIHVTLLAALDPIGAVDFVADLPNEHFIWPAAHHLHLHDQPELVDQVLAESSSASAALLALACELDAQHATITMRDAGETTWNDALPRRHKALASALIARTDAQDVISPWMRHLVRSAGRVFTGDQADRARIARIALEQLLAVVPGSDIELARAQKADAACVVSRMLIAAQHDKSVDYWNEWVTLICNEDRSLDENQVYWWAAGNSLYSRPDPLAAWTDAVRKLEPLLRARARRHERGIDPGVHLIMPAVTTAAAMKAEGSHLWWALYERARRHFFVDAPAENEFGYRLCSYVFAAFLQVFGNENGLEEALRLQPTAEHIAWARAQIPTSSQRTSMTP